jgi:hypothetical protein
VDDRRHRANGPAVERADGTKEWYINGEFRPTELSTVQPPAFITLINSQISLRDGFRGAMAQP